MSSLKAYKGFPGRVLFRYVARAKVSLNVFYGGSSGRAAVSALETAQQLTSRKLAMYNPKFELVTDFHQRLEEPTVQFDFINGEELLLHTAGLKVTDVREAMFTMAEQVEGRMNEAGTALEDLEDV
mmetsp:Transcript_11384/g.38486  ORF Transcript_11384/g.38486 Transcript_11384/m.38486 type:complete len:126 (-) Transcript_11384:58-435(-)